MLERSGGLKPGSAVVELGAWPGGWLQRLATRVGPSGSVVGIDLQPIDPVAPHVQLLQLDFTQPDAVDQIERALGGSADAIFSDAAPKLTGIVHVDRGACEELYDAALAIAERLLRPGGRLILKGFPGPEAQRFRDELRRRFARVREVRPEGKRATSKEFYWVALDKRPS